MLVGINTITESTGFEPAVPFAGYTAFREPHLKPLGQLSIKLDGYNLYIISQVVYFANKLLYFVQGFASFHN